MSEPTPLRTVAPFGSWPSPLKAEAVVSSIPPAAPDPDGDGLYWLELRPDEDGRSTLVYAGRGREPEALTPRELNVRSRVHEYGGGSFWRDGATLFFSNFWDGRLFRQDGPADTPRPITPEPREPGSLRYADGIAASGGRVICVRESHEQDGVLNELVVLPGTARRHLFRLRPVATSTPRHG